ncbi:MAG: hypothetical protein V4638_03400 [Bacteroidota bacterium]
MQQINQAHIEAAIDIVDNFTDDQLEAHFEKFSEKYPVVLSYIHSAADEYDNDELHGLLAYYFCLISECFEQGKVVVTEITEDDIEGFEEEFFAMLDEYFESDNFDLVEEYTDQSELIQFMLMEISTPDEDGSEMDDETATQLFIVTTAMITLIGKHIAE